MMIMAALAMTLIVIATAFSVDIGHQTSDRRDLQRTADMAAIDAALAELTAPGAEADAFNRADDSARRNGYDYTATGQGHSMDVDVGCLTANNDFVEYPGAACADIVLRNAVRVTLTGDTDYAFAPGRASQEVVGIAANQELTSYQAGSILASLDAQQSAIITSLLGGGLGLSATQVSALSYTGVLGADVTLDELALAAGFGTVDEFLDADVTVAEFYTATAQVLENQGNTAAYDFFNILSGGSKAGAEFDFDVFQFGLNDSSSGGSVGLDALQLATLGAQIANGNNAITLPAAALTVPGLANVTAQMNVVETPSIMINGREGSTIHTAQLRFKLSANIGSVLGGVVSLPLYFEAGSADATVEDIDCAKPKNTSRVRIGVQGGIANAYVGNVSNALFENRSQAINYADVTPATILNVAGLVQATIRSQLGLNVPEPQDLIFGGVGLPQPPLPNTVYDSDLTPFDEDDMLTAGGQELGLANITSPQLSVNALGFVPIDASALSATLLGLLNPALARIDTSLVRPLFQALGLNAGGADVTDFDLQCEGRRLVG